MPDIRIGYQYDSSGAAQMIRDGGRIKSTTDTAARGMDRLENETRQTGQAMATTAKQSALMNRSVGGLGSRFSRFGPQIQNASFQLQDIVVQMQMGAGASRALGQQLPQLLGGFGPLGAVLGLVAGGMASLVPLMFDFGEEAEETETRLERVTAALNSLTDALQTSDDNFRDAAKSFMEMSEAARELELQTMEVARLTALNQAREAFPEFARSVVSSIQDIQFAFNDGTRSSQDFAKDFPSVASVLLQFTHNTDQARTAVLDLSRQLARLPDTKANEAAAEILGLLQQYEDATELAENLATRIEELRTGIDRPGGAPSVIDDKPRGRDLLAEQYGFRTAFPTSLDNASTFREARFQTAALRAKRIARANEEAMREIERQTEQASDFFVSRFDNAFKSLITGTQSASEAFRNMAASMAADIASLLVKKTLLEPIVSATGLSSLFSGFFADGAAFQNGRVTAFASGGVVDRPTLFPMANGAGLMGEAGPEAVMPLQRGADGKLGVKSQGGGNVINQTINVNAGGGAGGGGNPQELAKLVGRAVRNSTREALMTESRPGGMLNRSVKV